MRKNIITKIEEVFKTKETIIESVEMIGNGFKIEIENDFEYTILHGCSDIVEKRIDVNKSKLFMLIESKQNCCEVSGFLSTNDDVNEFIGAEILDIIVVDDALKTKSLMGKLFSKMDSKDRDFIEKEEKMGDRRDTTAIFINIETNKGLLQFTLYNSHNGYYGHDVAITLLNGGKYINNI